ncbi:hypothetical protein, partial [Pantoea ananatis]|uniref:hypothetical protein n=1 Tax=Pantoea ananas TaxID=553 RepID=UPI0023AF44AB
LSSGVVFARLSPFAGAETSTNRLAVQGRLKPLAGKFFDVAKNFSARARTPAPARARYALCGERLSNG